MRPDEFQKMIEALKQALMQQKALEFAALENQRAAERQAYKDEYLRQQAATLRERSSAGIDARTPIGLALGGGHAHGERKRLNGHDYWWSATCRQWFNSAQSAQSVGPAAKEPIIEKPKLVSPWWCRDRNGFLESELVEINQHGLEDVRRLLGSYEANGQQSCVPRWLLVYMQCVADHGATPRELEERRQAALRRVDLEDC